MTTNRMQRGMARLASRLAARASVEITYATPDGSVTLDAVQGDTLLSLTDDLGGVRVERTDRDFLVRPSDLVIAGSRVRPARGHTVTLADAASGALLEYTVLPYESEPVYRDRMLGEMYRVHVKLTAEVPALALLDGLGAPLLDGLGNYLLGGG